VPKANKRVDFRGKKPKQCFILGNGEWGDPSEFFSLIQKEDLLIACNGGYQKAMRFGVQPDIVIGDLDSINPRIIQKKVRIIRFPANKDKTDGELALQLALKQKPQKIFWLAALGGRWDQTIANCFLLIQAAKKKVPVVLFQGEWRIYLVLNHLSVQGQPGERVSLIPLSNKVEGIFSKGLQYSLKNEELFRHRTRGVSNCLLSLKCSIKIKSGWLLVLHETTHKQHNF
jgi:thiamine pyrophosphokinase